MLMHCEELAQAELSRGGLGYVSYTLPPRHVSGTVINFSTRKARYLILCERGADRWQEIVVLSSLERDAS
jgi:hypothetical protein